MFKAIEQKKDKMKEVLSKAKEDCLQVIEDYFGELEKNWTMEMEREEKKHLVHDSYKLEGLSSLISREMSNLVDMKYRLNPSNLLDEAPRWAK